MEPPVSGYHLVSALRCGADDGGVEDAHLHDAVDGLLHELIIRHLEGVVLEGTNLRQRYLLYLFVGFLFRHGRITS